MNKFFTRVSAAVSAAFDDAAKLLVLNYYSINNGGFHYGKI